MPPSKLSPICLTPPRIDISARRSLRYPALLHLGLSFRPPRPTHKINANRPSFPNLSPNNVSLPLKALLSHRRNRHQPRVLIRNQRCPTPKSRNHTQHPHHSNPPILLQARLLDSTRWLILLWRLKGALVHHQATVFRTCHL